LTQTKLAKLAGVSQATIGKLESGVSSGSSHLHRIARALKTTPDYLTGDTNDPEADYVPVPSTDVVAKDLGLVPVREIDLTLGLGATFLDVPVTETIHHFPREWLRLYTKSPAEHLLFAQGVGDSMEPTIRDFDLLLIDCAQRTLNMSDKIWAIAYGDCGAVKRLRPLPDGSVSILSDNPNVPEATAYDGEMHLLGRVVAVVRKM
jgi:phage repressor protein C with HTH and peptisase S24 domain